MPVPKLLTTSTKDETYGGVSYHIEGELVPVLQIELSGVPVYFEHHVLLWKDPNVQITIKPLKGAFKRAVAGMPVLLTMASGPGRIGFSRDGAGHVFGLHLTKGQAVQVRENQFLAATDNLDYGFQRIKGASNILMGGTGFFIDTFTSNSDEGVLWLHGYGNVFDIILQTGETIDIEPGGWIYKDPSVNMQTLFQKLTTGLFAGLGQLAVNRFTGPGRIGIQSMYFHMPTE
jgi:uncharacterized protein (AIM24 family)